VKRYHAGWLVRYSTAVPRPLPATALAALACIPALLTPTSTSAADPEDEARRAFLLGRDAVRRGDLKLAVRSFSRAVELDSTEVGALRHLGRVHMELKEWDLAVEAFAAYLEMIPAAPDAFVVRGEIERCHRLKRDAGPVTSLIPRGVELQLPRELRPGTDEAEAEAKRRYNLGRSLNDNSLRELRRYLEAVTLDPTFRGAWYNLGVLFLTRRDADRAILAHQQYTRLNPESHEGWFLLGVDNQTAGKLPEAQEAYEEALRRDPRHFDSHNNLAVVLEARGRVKEAIAQYQRTIEVTSASGGASPSTARARYNLGDLYLQKHMVDDAMGQFEQVLQAKAAPGGGLTGMGQRVPPRLIAAAHDAMGQCHELREERHEAISQYAAALVVDPGFRQARANLLRLRGVKPR
jgi:tetratricopeptide (TPR) repeat protein